MSPSTTFVCNRSMEVQCPEGVQPGELVSFQTADGEWMEVAVPDGVMPGDHFTVEIDGAPAEPPGRAPSQPFRRSRHRGNIPALAENVSPVPGLRERPEML